MHAKPTVQLNVRLDPTVYETVILLTERYQTKANVIAEAVKLLARAVDNEDIPEPPDAAPLSEGKRARGGTPLFGFIWKNKRLVRSESQYPGLMRLVELKDSGLSYRKVADKLNSENIESATGRTWSGATVLKTYQRYQERKEDGTLENA